MTLVCSTSTQETPKHNCGLGFHIYTQNVIVQHYKLSKIQHIFTVLTNSVLKTFLECGVFPGVIVNC